MTGHINGSALDDSVAPSHGSLLADPKIRIVIVLPALGAGGSERVVSLIANSWADRGWKVAIITFERPDTPAYYEIDPRVELVRLGIPNERNGQLRGAWRAANRVRRLRRQLLRLAPNYRHHFSHADQHPLIAGRARHRHSRRGIGTQ